MYSSLPLDWSEQLCEYINSSPFTKLQTRVQTAYQNQPPNVYPPLHEVYSAFHLTPFDQVKVVLLGQDPYHGLHQAHGLSFSVKPPTKIPPSLRNMFKELQSDLGVQVPPHGNLTSWAQQGVLLLNTVLTVYQSQAHSHKNWGWEVFTDCVIRQVSTHCEHVVFLLWGTPAQKKAKLIDHNKHTLICSVHPSPLSAYRGFFGSCPFSRTNQALQENGQTPIEWTLS